MAGAYATLADDGVYHPPSFIDHIDDRNGKTIYRANLAGKRVLDPQISRDGGADAAGGGPVRHRHGGQPVRPAGGGQDGHDRAEHRRLVQRLHPATGHLDLDGGPQGPHAHVQRRRDHRLRRHLPGADLGRLHRSGPGRPARRSPSRCRTRTGSRGGKVIDSPQLQKDTGYVYRPPATTTTPRPNPPHHGVHDGNVRTGHTDNYEPGAAGRPAAPITTPTTKKP